MDKVVRALVPLLISVVVLASGCSRAQPAAPKPVQPKQVTFVGTIVAGTGDTLSVYVYDGYRGNMTVHLTDKTAIDVSLKPRLRPGAGIAFTTDGTMMKSEPPQVTALAVQSVTEAIVFRGKVREVGEDRITVDTTHPRREVIVVRVNDRTWVTPGLSATFEAGSTVEFETGNVMQPSEPAQYQMTRLLKNGPRMVQHAGTYLGAKDGLMRLQTRTATETIQVPFDGLLKDARQGSRVVVLAAAQDSTMALEQVRWLSVDTNIVGHFAYLDAILRDVIQVILMDGGLLQVRNDRVTLPEGMTPGALVYIEYRVDKVGEQSILRRIDAVFLDDEVVSAALNTTYVVERERITLVSGKHEKQATPGSAVISSALIWGSPATAHLDGDGQKDAALILVHQPGGSGSFFYAVACCWSREKGAWVGTNAILLGDRIAPQNVSVSNGVITVNYATRRPGEPMAAQPSVGVSKRLMLEGRVLKEVR